MKLHEHNIIHKTLAFLISAEWLNCDFPLCNPQPFHSQWNEDKRILHFHFDRSVSLNLIHHV